MAAAKEQQQYTAARSRIKNSMTGDAPTLAVAADTCWSVASPQSSSFMFKDTFVLLRMHVQLLIVVSPHLHHA
jgi:hypothetical protein